MDPIFVSGIGRSGTSALIKAITHHKDVYKPSAIGEAPFIQKFIQFLHEYEETGANVDYHLANYKISNDDKHNVFAELMFLMQNGMLDSESEESYWVAKLTPTLDEYKFSRKIFKNLRNVGIVRNGIEVVNSAKSFKGFADLNFEQLCQRWTSSLKVTEYLGSEPLTCIIRHIDLVSNASETFTYIFDKLELDQHSGPAEFLSKNIFNSSFDSTSNETADLVEVFENRANCWFEWSDDDKAIFVDICDEGMKQYEFFRPYVDSGGVNTGGSEKNLKNTTTNTTIIKPVKKLDIVLSKKIEKLFLEKDRMNLVNYHCNISSKYNYLFWENPKVLSTTLLSFLQRNECSEKSALMTNSHQRSHSPLNRISKYDPETQDQILFGSDYFKFAFVRNPYARLLSAYKSKVERNLPAKYEILSVINNESNYENLNIEEKISFAQFVDVVCSQDTKDMNSHWKTQKYQIHADVIEYDHIGKLETVSEDLEIITSKIFGNATSELPISKNFTDSSKLIDQYYDSVLVEKVYQKFEEDFDLFEYKLQLNCLAA